MKTRIATINADFICSHCHQYISADSLLAGVHNRNHCPYCLWSRHMDWKEAGDRLSACKAGMQPIGLTVKRTNKKYERRGELMLIHRCSDCGKLSINRIAADDIPEAIYSVFEKSDRLSSVQRREIELAGIEILGSSEQTTVIEQLFGTEIPEGVNDWMKSVS